MKVDVVLLTKNSVNPCLKECLESIRKQLPINRLIIVDGGSTDGTIELCKAIFPAAQIIYDVKGNRATARQIGIDQIRTDWFVFMDSDVILKDGWFKNASKYMVNPDTGAVQGSTLQIVEPRSNICLGDAASQHLDCLQPARHHTHSCRSSSDDLLLRLGQRQRKIRQHKRS